VLPFAGLYQAHGEAAVDSVGNLYVTDSGNNRVLRLPPG
jgi:DNA-binding beta-propeller fold protein YncE